MYTSMNTFSRNKFESGQGLVEYALILVLVAVVVLVILSLLGPNVGAIFCTIAVNLAEDPELCENGSLVVSNTHYNKGQDKLTFQVVPKEGASSDLMISTSPAGTVALNGDHYKVTIDGINCPCTVTVRSSTGGFTVVKES